MAEGVTWGLEGGGGACEKKQSLASVVSFVSNSFLTLRRPGAKKRRPRLVSKKGQAMVEHQHPPKKLRTQIRNWFMRLIEEHWRWLVLLIIISFLTSWFCFALLYYTIAYFHGDFKTPLSANHTNCAEHVVGLTSAFLFSIETQHTIGYGYRYIHTECGAAIVVLCLQSIVGVIMQALLAGIVLAKLLRPKKRSQEIIFSKNAVIYNINGKRTLTFRVADMTKEMHLCEAHVRLYMAHTEVTEEGDVQLLSLTDLNVGFDTGADRLLLLWPVVVHHVIDKSSPLYQYTNETMRDANFELIVVVEGGIETTGMTCQSRSSYIPEEILWHRRFAPVVAQQEENGVWRVQYKEFNKTIGVVTKL